VLLIVALALLAALAGGCRESTPEPPGPEITLPVAQGQPRSALLGFAAISSSAGGQAGYAASFATAAEWGDVVMIQRAPPWEEFREGGHISQATEELTRFEQSLISQYDLQVFFVIDPTDPTVERSRLIDVPQEDFARGFEDADLRGALSGYAAYIARNYRPAYLAIGAEIDMYADRNPPQFESFLPAYEEAYEVAKAASPETLVFPTFQLEDIEGNFGAAHPPRWDLLLAFSGKMDALAVTTYPFLTALSSARSLRPDYYSQLHNLFDGPVIVAGAGYTSVPIRGSAVPGTEEDQFIYLEQLRDAAEDTEFELVVWLSAFDPPVSAGGTEARFQGIGLLAADGTPKLAWDLWQEWARRPPTAR